jgi:ribosomal protein L37AE/L43A
MQTDTDHIAYVAIYNVICPSCEEVMERRILERASASILECPQCRLAVLPDRIKQTINVNVS